MNFKNWIHTEDMKQLAKAYSALLKDVPQDPQDHPEGGALVHIKLVRRAIPRAIEELKELQKTEPFSSIFSKINFDVTPEEMDILIIAAWLHDIGKASATVIDAQTGRITSKNHQDAVHYLPHIEKLLHVTPEKISKLYFENKELIHFLIERHMDLTMQGGFSTEFLKKYYENGSLKNDQKVKLLIILMWADKMGRTPETIKKALEKNKKNLLFSTERAKKLYIKQNKPKSTKFSGSPEELAQILKDRGLSKQDMEKFLKGKFPELSDDEVEKLL